MIEYALGKGGDIEMRRSSIIAVFVSLMVTMVSIAWAATNLNSSKSNIYRLVYSAEAVTSSQATAILAELDKIGPADEARLKQWLPANFKRHGVQGDSIKKIIIIPADKTRKSITIILLTNPADEPAARHIAVSDSGAVGKPTIDIKK